jgi:ABC-type oligopeptide transport system substrate-binding subunit/tRNA A-37 threonylcarbamoyl transferase component Bud32
MEIGDTLQNRYRIEASLGQGGMGTVYRGYDMLLDRPVAIKILRWTPADGQSSLDSEGRTRLLNEAQAAARLSHPNIVAVYDAGEVDGIPFIVMQYVAGHSLHRWVEEGRPAPVDDVLDIARQLCAALEHAHASGVIHRDIKPENVLLGDDGVARLTDFGLARSLSSRLTVEGAIIGTVFYLAPELALGQPYDGRADLYSLGVMLYELLAGRLPFIADEPISVISQHLYAPVVPPSTYNSQISPALDALILRLMSKSPADRPISAESVRQALVRLESPVVVDSTEAAWPLERIAHGRMVGRARELAEVQRLWQRAAAGQGQVLLISGEPGIGKTRLARELSARAEVSGGLALLAACYAESSAPYAPVARLIRLAFTATSRPPRAPLDLSESTLDALGMLAPDCCGERQMRERPELDPRADQQRLFDSLVTLFRALARRAPVLIIFEDVHWADSGTLALVRRLARHVPDLPLLLVLTYREVELGESRVLSDLLYELNRQRLGERIKLTRLSRDETGELLAAMFADQPGPEFVDLIYRETEGNPFFVEEVCKALVDEGRISHQSGHWQASSLAEMGVPQSVRMAIEARVGRLPGAAQDVLRLAAVFGREFDYDLLQAVSAGAENQSGNGHLSEEALIDALEAAQRAQLIVEAPRPGGQPRPSRLSFSFTHALIPSALLDDMSTMRRQRLHRRAGLALERLASERPADYPKDRLAARLSHHFIEAGDHARAVGYLLQAGDQARLLFVYPEAIQAYEQAHEFLEEQGQYEAAARTLMKLGLVYHLAYDFPRSRQAYQQGFELWQQAISRSDESAGRGGRPAPASRPFHAASGNPRSLDPASVGDEGTGNFTFLLFEGLADLTPENDLVPAVARSWEILQDGQRYIFRLRRDARWSDGAPLTAQDFVFAWRRTLNPANRSPLASLLYDVRGARSFHSGENPDPASLGVSAPDDWTLVVELDEPVGYFLYIMAHYAAFPVPRHALLAHGDAWATPEYLVCNGPFRLASWQVEKSMTLERNPHYTGRFYGNLQKVEFDLVYDRERFLASYEAGELDVVGLSAKHLERMRYRYPGEYITSPTPGLSFIGFNQAFPPLDNPLVRRALVHATDRAGLVDLLSQGYPMPVKGGFLPPGIQGYSPEIGLAYDPDLARRLLAQAGYPGGQGFPELNLYLIESKELDRMSEFIQRGWQEILGIRLHFQHSDLIKFVSTPDLPGLWYITWVADYPDADNFLRVALEHYQVLQTWDNPEFKRMIEAARRSLDLQQRAQIYRDADRLLINDAVLMPLNYTRHHLLVKPWIKNFRPGPHHFYFLKEVILEA